MVVEGDPMLTPIANKQFEMIGVKLKFADIPDSGVITVGKTKDYWYNIYKFTEQQEKEWRDWARQEMAETFSESEENQKDILMYLELRYGFTIRYIPAGKLF